MALEPITHTDPSPVPDASVPQGESVAPAGMGNLDGKSPEELAQLLGQMAQGGQQGVQPTPDPADQQPQENQPQTPQPAQPAAAALQIPDKFKNQDGSLNAEALIKSQADGQSYASQVKNEMEQMRAENTQLMQMAEDFQNELRTSKQAAAQAKGPEMSDAEIEDYNANPKAYMAQEMKKELAKMNNKIENNQTENHRDRMLDFKVTTARSKIENEEGFKDIAEDYNKILSTNMIDYDPRGPELARNAAMGMRMPQIVADAKNQAFTEGYEKAKSELSRQVSGGGGSTLPAGGANMDDETLNQMSPEEMIRSGLLNVHPSK